MQESFYDVLKRGDVEKARAIAKVKHPTQEELKHVLFMAVTEMHDEKVIDVLHFLRGEMNVDMLAKYNENEETVLHVAARLKKIVVMAALIFMGIPFSALDKNGRTAPSYLNEAEKEELAKVAKSQGDRIRAMKKSIPSPVKAPVPTPTATAPKPQVTKASGLKRGFFSTPKKEVPQKTPLALIKETIDKESLEAITEEKVVDFLKKIESQFDEDQIKEILCYANFKAYQFMLDKKIELQDCPKIQAVLDSIKSTQAAWIGVLNDFCMNSHVTFAQVEKLVNQGAYVNDRDGFKKTMLHWTVEKGYEAIVELLDKNGADWDAQDMYGVTPRQLREQKNSKQEDVPYVPHPAQYGPRK